MALSYLDTFPFNVTQPAIDVFLDSKQDDGQIAGITYWQTANAYTAIALHDAWSNTSTNADRLDELVAMVQNATGDCINDYNDDSMWWAMGLLELYGVTHDARHLAVVENIWSHVVPSMIAPGQLVIDSVDMAGGVLWSDLSDETQVNSITTGLFAELSARLSTHAEDASARDLLLEYAILSMDWIYRCRYIADDYLVLDHIDIRTGETFDANLTYNTGQAIAASVAIYDAAVKNDTGGTITITDTDTDTDTDTGGGGGASSATMQMYLDQARLMAMYSMNRTNWVDRDGTLTERDAYPGPGDDPLSPWQDDDAVGFKAILLRNLVKLYKVLKRDGIDVGLQGEIAQFVRHQFWRLQDRDTNGRGQYGPWWAGPMDAVTSHSQLAALDVMAAIHAVV
ncbi:hypothetical protein PV08_10453 [Exophiala spinifera]|uniref:Uncharacterized protein n=1 Tax=Exophiala spinifera TaxID=91928 RepID=A0A0D2AWS6_9EURO|nr:uncharacterized protein PV08_10453 [Exophiala spinifera]KIW11153.1 hypothetical protein PV08_10453 [Exophiala spinifera]